MTCVTPELWAFITGSASEWPTHIDLLFRAMAGSTDGKEQHRYWVFEELRPRIENRPAEFWRDVVRMHGLITGWFHDRTLYHLIGFLIAPGIGTSSTRIVELPKAPQQRVQVGLIERIRRRIGLTSTTPRRPQLRAGPEACQQLLLLMNVATILGPRHEGATYPAVLFP